MNHALRLCPLILNFILEPMAICFGLTYAKVRTYLHTRYRPAYTHVLNYRANKEYGSYAKGRIHTEHE